MRSIGVELIALVSFLLVISLQSVSAAETCECKYMRARSEAPAGLCAVREDYPRDCDLVWAAPPGTQQATLGRRADQRSVIQEITRAAAGSPNPRAESAAPGLGGIAENRFWDAFQSEVSRRSGVREADLYNHALSFLLNRGAASDFPHFVVAALIYVSAAGLQQSVPDAGLRGGFLEALLANSDRLVAFGRASSEAQLLDRITEAKSQRGPVKLSIQGIVLLGCFEFFEDGMRVAQLVKTEWSLAKGGRCRDAIRPN
jgi:hypothetical protein